jgi:hypothetical protein
MFQVCAGKNCEGYWCRKTRHPRFPLSLCRDQICLDGGPVYIPHSRWRDAHSIVRSPKYRRRLPLQQHRAIPRGARNMNTEQLEIFHRMYKCEAFAWCFHSLPNMEVREDVTRWILADILLIFSIYETFDCNTFFLFPKLKYVMNRVD